MRHVPYIAQVERADCGAACLAMVLRFHGIAVDLEHVRTEMDSIRGATALSILRAARELGLAGRGVRVDVEHLVDLPAGTILHWGFSHFVVFERITRRSVDLVDPAFGRRRVSIKKFSQEFTGIALVFDAAHVQKSDVRTTNVGDAARRYLVQSISHPWLITRIVAFSILLRALALALPLLTAVFVDRVVPGRDYGLIHVLVAGSAAVLLFQAVTGLIRSHMLLELRTKLDNDMTSAFLRHLLSLPFDFFVKRQSGDLFMRIGSNAQIRELLTSSLLSTVLDGFFAFAYLALLCAVSPVLAFVTTSVGAAQLALLAFSRHRYADLAAQELESQARTHSYLVQAISGIESVKLSGAESRVMEHWSNLYTEQLNVSLSRNRLQAALDALNGIFQSAAPLALLTIGSANVISGRLTLGEMLGAIALATGFLSPLASLLQNVFQLQLLKVYMSRIIDVLAAKPSQERGSTRTARLTGSIQLTNVSFRYGKSEPFVLQDVSLSIPAGASVAIVGRSGSGKSTLAAILVGLRVPTSGSVSYDGHNLLSLNHELLRQQVGSVPQHPFIFSGSIRSNIALAEPTKSMASIEAAAKTACVHDDIVAMPMGYETVAADGGSSLSGGQRQRIALARAVLMRPVILILDEATSSLDATTERALVNNLRALSGTRVIIAHRLSTIVQANLIVVLEAGRAVETGTHQELIARNGVYARLIADQGTVASPHLASGAEDLNPIELASSDRL